MRRLPTGGLIDRSKPIAFVFDGNEYEGFAGDTLASALLANDVMVVGKSPILGRPRGIMTAGPDEPCALVEVTEPYVDLIVPATMVPLEEGLIVRSMSGVGRLPTGPAKSVRVRHRHAHVETLVVGARSALPHRGRQPHRGRVMIVDRDPSPWAMGRTGPVEIGSWLRGPEATVLLGAAVVGVFDDGYVLIHERSRPIETLWHVRAADVVLGAGLQERLLAFAGNDRPGVMLSGAVRAYVERFALVPNGPAVVFTTNERGEDAAGALAKAGVPVYLLSLVTPTARHRALPEGCKILSGSVVVGTRGSPRLAEVLVASDESVGSIEADVLAVSGGWNPELGLFRGIGGQVRYDAEMDWFEPASGPPWLRVSRSRDQAERFGLVRYPFVPADDLSEHFVDLQRDQTVADIVLELDAGLRSVEHIKRATYIGTAVDQGRTSSALAAEVVNALLGSTAGTQGPTSARPPWSPVPFHVLAGPYRGALFDPVRTTPIHPWHALLGAVFEDVGQWKRARYYPRDGEDMDAAVQREGRAVRTGVGMMDASTLGKIDVVGPDAGVFLDRMYTNAMSTLGVGKIRYGLMLGLDGMVFDDGVAMRLAEDHYLVTTTTGGAARVLDRFEEWLQTEWPDLRVYCTSVTEQWATIPVAGPQAREQLASVGTDIDLSNGAFPFMTWREGTFAGVPARLARVSFSGELAIEVNVAAWHGLRVWEALLEAGQAFDLTPYGTEAMHVLRAEKGFAIVGQDTDGTVTPDDLGMSWIVNRKKGDFVGLRSLGRPDTIRDGRKQLVGLLPADPNLVLREGSQLVAAGAQAPRRSIGHVTSSYYGPGLGRSFALALVESGGDRHGETVMSPLAGEDIPAVLTSPILYDPGGARRDG
jgi:sarcosine oxidase subunit alpha